MSNADNNSCSKCICTNNLEDLIRNWGLSQHLLNRLYLRQPNPVTIHTDAREGEENFVTTAINLFGLGLGHGCEFTSLAVS